MEEKSEKMLLTTTEASERLGICKRLLIEAVENKEIRCIKKNGRMLFRPIYLIEYVEKLERESSNE